MRARVPARLEEDEPARMQVATDMVSPSAFGVSWLIVTDKRLIFVPGEGPRGTGAPADGGTGRPVVVPGAGTAEEEAPDRVVEVPIAEVREARVHDLVGGARLEVERKHGPPLHCYYSNSLSAKFAEVAGGIQELSKGEDPKLPLELEKTRCEQCGRWLPEKDGICPFCIRKWDTLKRIARFLTPYRGRAALLAAISLVVTGVELVPPLLISHILDDVLVLPDGVTVAPAGSLSLLAWFVSGLLVVRLLSWGLGLGSGLLRADLASWTSRDIRSQLYQSLQFLPLRFYDKRQVGNLISRFLNDADRLEMFLLFGLPFLVTNTVMLVGVLGLLFYMNWVLTLYVLFPVPFIVLGSVKLWEHLRRAWNRWSAKWGRLSTHLNESISGIRMVKAFAQEDREARRFSQRNDELRDASVRSERMWFIAHAVMSFLMSFGIFFVWYFGGKQILAQELTLGVLMAFISYVWQLYRPLTFFSGINNFITRAFAGAERIFEVMDARAEPFADPAARPAPRLEGRVEFKGVTFGYDAGKPVLRDIDLIVEPGEMIGLVGRSGVGKSTMINLICRFYEVDRGALEVDGVDIRHLRLEDVRRQIGMVSQESFLFDGTIAENIRYGKGQAAFEDIVRAARAANAHEFIVGKPEGYDTVVGERGGKLSGGEKQRVAIARAILHDPRILILDEATALVDTPTEQKLQTAITRLVEGRTTFAIAHRLSTLRNADRLVVLDEGSICEVGTHEELMAREGIFHKLVQTQQQTTAVMAVGGGKDDPTG